MNCLHANQVIRIIACALALAAVSADAIGATIQTLGGETFEGKVEWSPAGLPVITPAGGAKREIAWSDVRVARFAPPPQLLKPLPRGWHTEEIGKISGTTAQKDGAFLLSTAPAESQEGKRPPLLCAYRLARAEPIVSARILEMSGDKKAAGGVLLRENLEVAGGYALLGVTGDRRLRLETCENAWTSPRVRDFGPVTLPVAVRLTMSDKEGLVTASHSSDGETWHDLVTDKLHCPIEPYPENGDQWKPRIYAGVAVSNPGGTMRCDKASVTIRGLYGEYFADDNFAKVAFSRPDRQVDYWWGDHSPAPTLEVDHFSVRWTGWIEPKHSENYRFYYEPDGCRLWVNGQELPPLPWAEGRRHMDSAVQVPLVAGKKYGVRFEYVKARNSSKGARLGWASAGQPREIIPASAMTYQYDDSTFDEEGAMTNEVAAAGIWLRSGSFIAGEVVAADASSVLIERPGQKPQRLLNNRIARVVLRSTRKPIRFELAANRTGIFLRGGDFLESDLTEVNPRSVIVNSVLFGRRTYPRDASQGAMALVLNNLGSSPAPLEVTLSDGSVVRARSVRTEGAAVVLDEVSVGELRAPISVLQQVRNAALAVQVRADGR